MSEKSITLNFDLQDEMHKRLYSALKNLQGFYDEPDLSKAVIRFVNDLAVSLGECEDRKERCQSLLTSLLGKQAQGRINWQ